MEIETSFPEKDMCPPMCDGVGAFKQVKLPAETIDSGKEKAEAPKPAMPTSSPPSQPTTSEESEYGPGPRMPTDPNNPADYEYLPGLKPGPDGQVDWTPLGDMTGTRPPVSKYSLERYSLAEWRRHNESILDPSVITNSNIVDYNAKTSIMQAFGNVDKQQSENNKRLKQKAKDLFRWKVEVELAVKSITAEVEKLEAERQRLKGASRTLMLPEAISKECLELRTNRAVPDLVADLAEQELHREMKMVEEVRASFKKALKDVEDQLEINKAAKHRIEYDWCDKTLAYNCETTNIGLTTKSKTIMFRPGATRFGEFSAPLEYWEHFCRENIMNVEAARQKSVDLRGGLQAILDQGGRKLRMQADKTDVAIAETVAITQELLTKLEKQLLDTLQKIADMENLIQDLQDSIRKMDSAMKLAQTRLDNRNNWRPHGESVRDQPHLGLIDEVRKIHETVTSLYGQLTNSRRVWKELMDKRIMLEKGIAAKRKTLCIDRDRCGVIRSHYPSASELAGY